MLLTALSTRTAPALPDDAEGLLARLSDLQRLMLAQVSSFGDDAFRRQFHADLSPAGWHLGHCVYTENFWLTQVGAVSSLTSEPAPEWTQSLMPDNSDISERGSLLPDRPELIGWVQRKQNEHLAHLRHLAGRHDQELLSRYYLLHFLIQHYAQHLETLSRIKNYRTPGRSIALPLSSSAKRAATVYLSADHHRYGADTEHFPYDNEHPAGLAACGDIHISQKPISNRQYLAFVRDGGYHDKRYWCDEGWGWRQQHGIVAPEHWEKNGNRHQIRPCHHDNEAAEEPVCGISWYEANACATWAGGRLPHEKEWEAASRLNLLQGSGLVWEWCRNELYPYPGFQPFPYEGYSIPYFNKRRFVLRGGSRKTLPEMRRHSFRNFYLPGIRSLYSGLRVVYD